MLPAWVLSRRSRPCFSLGTSAESPGVLGGRASGLMRGTICTLGQLSTISPSAQTAGTWLRLRMLPLSTGMRRR